MNEMKRLPKTMHTRQASYRQPAGMLTFVVGCNSKTSVQTLNR